jgi:protein O-mannosyl-transferase
MPATESNSRVASSRRGPGLAALALVLATLAAWSTTFSGAFVFDDFSAIVENPTIRHLWPFWAAWQPQRMDLTVSGRPLLNFSLAVSHALSGLQPWGYHAVNLALHLLAGLTLFGLVRRTLVRLAGVAGRDRRTPAAAGPAGSDATLLAFTAALLWLLHPLQTEAVTYIIQRAESLMGLLFLLTLYGFVRSVESPRPWVWRGVAVGASLLGAAAKEVSAVAPLLVLLYDRTFVAGTFREAWRRRWPLHLALLANWLLLAWLVAGTGWSRGDTAGFGLGISVGAYWLTQFGALARYLALTVWPHPLVGDYGMVLVHSAAAVWPQALLVLALLGGTAAALVRRSAPGFAGAWFFVILAPTSIVPVATQTMAEHRMYLPLAAAAVLAAAGAHRLAGRRGLFALLALAPALGWLTHSRNAVYRTERSFWRDVATKCPANARAYINLGNVALARGELAGAIAQYETALRLQPDLPDTESNLCNALTQDGRPAEAVAHGLAALRLAPQSPNAHVNLGNAFMHLRRPADAIGQYEAALRVQPDAADTEVNLGTALLQVGRAADAVTHYAAALRLEPGRAETEYALAGALMHAGDAAAARRHYAAAIRLQPDFIAARFDLGNALAQAHRFDEAIAQFREIVRLDPRDLQARNNLGNAFLMLGRFDDAIAVYEDALRLDPADPTVKENLRLVRAIKAGAPPPP